MKKVGIITYHFARNYGAVLQCYALQEYLKSKGYNVSIINYVSEVQQNNNDYYKHGKSLKKLIINICLLPFLRARKRKNANFDYFEEKYLNLTNKISNIDELKKLVNVEKYDVLISGSDQVFNPNIEDFDIAFLFPFLTEAKKISYAASTGNATKEDISKISKYLKDFYAISIREEKDLGKFDSKFSQIKVVCDPVMLLNKNDWQKISKCKQKKEKYLVCYFLHKSLLSNEYKIAKKIAKERGLKLKIINARFSILSLNKNCILDIGPSDFIGLINNASFVCTDSFHGTLFSILFEKNFLCFDSKKNKNDSRRKNLLDSLGLLDSLYIVEEQKSIKKIDYNNVKKNINVIKKKSEKFFQQVLEEKINEKY